MSKKDPFAVFEKMTKSEIISWMRKNSWMLSSRLPTESDILYTKWEKLSYDALEESRKHIEQGERIAATGWQTEYNNIAHQCNNTSDIQEKIRLIDKLSRLRKPWDDHVEDYKRIDALQKKANDLYEKYRELQDRESQEARAI